MPYSKLTDLPAAVKGLPKHGQEIWQAAFNAAFKQYNGDETKSAATAWAAVKGAGYEKGEDGTWRRSQESAISGEIARLRPVDPARFTVHRVCESAVLMADAKQQIGVLPYTEQGGVYVFGQFRYPPIDKDDPQLTALVAEAESMPRSATIERTPETFTAKESEQIAFTASEGVTIGGQVYHAKPDVGEYPVFIVAEGVNRAKKRAYTAKAMESVPDDFYAGCPMHLDHAGKEGELTQRSVRDFCGKVVKSGRAVVHEGVKKIPAVVKFVDSWTREHMADPDWRSMVGLSHVADVAGYVGKVGKDTMRVVESIVHPYAVDVVSSAAFGGKVMEAAGVDRRMEDLTMLETVSLKDLETHRPELVKEIQDAARVTFRAQESEDEAVKAANTRAEAAEAQAKATRLELHKVKVQEAAVAEVAKPDHKIPETARPLIVSRVTARLGGAELSADKLSETVQGAVKEEIALGQAFVPVKPAPKLPPNRAQGGDDARASLQQRFDRTFGAPAEPAKAEGN